MRLDRLLAIVVKLLNRNRISAQELADEFEVTLRTIYRDMEAINLSGIPVISYQGQQGGFGIMENYKLDRQVLTLQDITAILSALKGFQATFPDKKVTLAADKIRNLLPRDKIPELSNPFESIVIDMLPWGASQKQKQHLNVVYQALLQAHLLKFSYRNSRGEEATRVVEPMTLIFKMYVWYLYAYCRLKKGWRLFRLTRMSRLTPLQKTFIRRDYSYREFTQSQAVVQTAPKWVSLTMKFSPRLRYRAEDMFDHGQTHAQKNGSVLIRVTWPDDDGLYAYLLSCGEDLEVLKPDSVRAKLYAKAKQIAGHYNS